ncbi:uncharacterized protein LOC110183109 [Drosophila serrata]|uniref:uncharacterized protein LOC110183109 n=1 Tax=Drosophila serrata TaxID=7274 RepID=UPI000A1D16A4|nr:uncharacterized protein LOC110183109 [Drosophila serrata]
MRFLLVSAAVLLLLATPAITIPSDLGEDKPMHPVHQRTFKREIKSQGRGNPYPYGLHNPWTPAMLAALEEQNGTLADKLKAAEAEISKLRESQRVKDSPPLCSERIPHK